MNNIEHQHQVALFTWIAHHKWKCPGLALAFAVPNGGARTKRTGAMLKAEGVRAGVSDIFLPVARNGFHGLFIEMKAPKGRVSEQQDKFLADMVGQGYCGKVCYGWESARDAILEYMGE